MITILLYCVVCYLIMFGILLDEYDTLDEWKKQDIFSFIFAPVLIPIFIGIYMNENCKDNDSWQD